jgi:hypothetical protein
MKRPRRIATDAARYTITTPAIPERVLHDVDEAIEHDEPVPVGMHLVTDQSRLVVRKAVHKLAVYFQREFQYDFVQYSAKESGGHAYLWLGGWEHRPTAIGACYFSMEEWANKPPCWALRWIWLHPYERSHGHLTEAWPYFEKRYGEFHVEHPISEAMEGFLRKYDKTAPRVWVGEKSIVVHSGHGRVFARFSWRRTGQVTTMFWGEPEIEHKPEQIMVAWRNFSRRVNDAHSLELRVPTEVVARDQG